jgi:hypothetical protein
VERRAVVTSGNGARVPLGEDDVVTVHYSVAVRVGGVFGDCTHARGGDIGHGQCRRHSPRESSGASAVIAATSSWVSEIRAAARLSLRCSTLVVPGIGSALVGAVAAAGPV